MLSAHISVLWNQFRRKTAGVEGAESIDPQIFRFMFVRSRALDWYVEARQCVCLFIWCLLVSERIRERGICEESPVFEEGRTRLKINDVYGLVVCYVEMSMQQNWYMWRFMCDEAILCAFNGIIYFLLPRHSKPVSHNAFSLLTGVLIQWFKSFEFSKRFS